jgi:GAF domain-containing protein
VLYTGRVKASTESARHAPTATPAVESAADPEYRTLLRLAEAVRRPRPRHPEEALQPVVDLAREMTGARYAALSVSDEEDRTEGFVTSGLSKAQLRGLKIPPQGHGPLGSLRSDGKPVKIDDLDDHPRAFGFPPHHPTMKSLLGVPIWADGQVRGSLYVTDRDGGRPFTDDDVVILQTLARHAGTVVEKQWY